MSMTIIKFSAITRDKNVADIIESVTMKESSISHIVSAEEEKLQASIDMKEVSYAGSVAVNKSVENTIDSVIQLEMNLQKKLKAFDCQINGSS